MRVIEFPDICYFASSKPRNVSAMDNSDHDRLSDHAPSVRKRSLDTRIFCPHCNQSVSERTYYRHKRANYSSSTKTWQKEAELSDESGGETNQDDPFTREVMDDEGSVTMLDCTSDDSVSIYIYMYIYIYKYIHGGWRESCVVLSYACRNDGVG